MPRLSIPLAAFSPSLPAGQPPDTSSPPSPVLAAAARRGGTGEKGGRGADGRPGCRPPPHPPGWPRDGKVVSSGLGEGGDVRSEPRGGRECGDFRTRYPPPPPSILPGEARRRARAGAGCRRGSLCCRWVEWERIAVSGVLPLREGTGETRGSRRPAGSDSQPGGQGNLEPAGVQCPGLSSSLLATLPGRPCPAGAGVLGVGGVGRGSLQCPGPVEGVRAGRRDGKVAGNLSSQHAREMLCPGFTLAAD